MQDIWELVALHVRFGNLAQVVPMNLRYIGAIKIQRRYRERLQYLRYLNTFIGKEFQMRCASGLVNVMLTRFHDDYIVVRRLTNNASLHYFFMNRRDFFCKVRRGDFLTWDDVCRL